ncbi:hypothetical protein ABZ504_46555, partial [Streptomyces mirabilis]|uniref:hypothetical protein n=1 Tax=Streptomyces mirabilis TaxID=68239 RepID=UPI0033EEF947
MAVQRCSWASEQTLPAIITALTWQYALRGSDSRHGQLGGDADGTATHTLAWGNEEEKGTAEEKKGQEEKQEGKGE